MTILRSKKLYNNDEKKYTGVYTRKSVIYDLRGKSCSFSLQKGGANVLLQSKGLAACLSSN